MVHVRGFGLAPATSPDNQNSNGNSSGFTNAVGTPLDEEPTFLTSSVPSVLQRI